MLLSVFDRLVLLNVLPKEGDLTTLRIIRDLLPKLSFSEDELQLLQFTPNDKGTTWQPNAVGEVEIQIGPKANQMIVEAFEALNKQKKLTLELMLVYEKFQKEE